MLNNTEGSGVLPVNHRLSSQCLLESVIGLHDGPVGYLSFNVHPFTINLSANRSSERFVDFGLQEVVGTVGTTFLNPVRGDSILTDRQVCNLHKGALETVASVSTFSTLRQIGSNLHFFGNGFRVLVKQQVKEVRRHLVFVISRPDRNRQGVKSAVS